MASTLRLRAGWALAAVIAIAACSAEPEAPLPLEPELRLLPISYDELDGWQQDDPAAALGAFRRSCARLASQPDSRTMARDPAMAQVAGTLAAWRGACGAAAGAAPDQARAFFEDWFQPYRVTDRDQPDGLFTGYYEPLLYGSRRYGGAYTVPLYRAPDDLVLIDLGLFKPDLAGREIAGRIDGKRFVPYYGRAEIDDGALQGRGLELVWVDDPVATFFLQIQGSGQIELDDGARIRVGYDGQNGHQYHAIGRDLVAQGALTLEEVSLQSIRDWLIAHPAQAREIMARNASYVFFRERPELDPVRRPDRCPGRAADRRPLARRRPALHSARRADLARDHGAVAGGRRPAAAPPDRPGQRRCGQGAGAWRCLLGHGAARRGDRRPHEEPGPLRDAAPQGGGADQLAGRVESTQAKMR